MTDVHGLMARDAGDMAFEARLVRRLSWRLIPFLILCFCLAYVDRTNVGFAALTMNKDLGFTPTVFGLGAGIFFIGYFFFEVPSNLVLAQVGARRAVAGLAGMLTLSRRSDRTGERRLHCGFGFALGTLGLVGSALTDHPVLRLAGFAVALYGFQGAQPIVWTIPASLLTGSAAAAGLALINSIGGLAGFFGPALIGFAKAATGSYGLGMAVLACFGLTAAAVAVGRRAHGGRDEERRALNRAAERIPR